MLSVDNELVLCSISSRDTENIGVCAEKNATKCDCTLLGVLCTHCFVWIAKNVPRNCAWVRKD